MRLAMSSGSHVAGYWSFQVDLALQHDLIASCLTKAFPNVTSITFMDLVRWSKVQIEHQNHGEYSPETKGEGARSNRGSKEDSWLPEILPGHALILMALNTAGCLKKAHDYAGILRAALGAPLGDEIDEI